MKVGPGPSRSRASTTAGCKGGAPRSATVVRTGRLSPGAVLLAVTLAACNSRALLNCVAEPAAALDVTIVDARTGAYLAAGATVLARDGSFSEWLGPGNYAPGGDLASRRGAFGRPGTYDVTVSHPGYEDWSTRARVGSDRCGAVTVPIRAVLAGSEGAPATIRQDVIRAWPQ